MRADSGGAKHLREKIESAFAHRELPAILAEQFSFIDSDAEDALWFNGRDWRSITCENWQEHNCAVIFLPDGAFEYYLQSLLILTIENPESYPDLAVNSVIFQLDRTPGGGLDGGPADRFAGLHPDEYIVMKEWLLYVCLYPGLQGVGRSASGPGERFGRAFDTIDRLKRMTAGDAEDDANPAATAQ